MNNQFDLLILYNCIMKCLKINFETIEGYYYLTVFDGHSFTLETNISGLENKCGVIENYDLFEKRLNEINISSWDRYYNPDGLDIEDGVKWSVILDDYSSSGVEGYWPYNYDKLIDIIMMIDNKANYFKANLAE